MNLEELKALEDYATESLSNFIPYVRIKEDGDYIEAAGFRTYPFELSLKKAFGSSRIYKGIFLSSHFRALRFHKFFALELAYICKKLIDEGGHRCSVGDLKSIIAGLYKNTWLKDTIDEDKKLEFDYGRISKEMNVTPFPYQKAFLENYQEVAPKYNLRGYLAELAAGSGKTLLGYFFSLATNSDTTIILCPKPVVKQVWVSTLEKNFKRPKKYWDSVDKGRITGSEDYIICHHQAMDEVLDNVRRLKGKKITIWIDESHKMTEESSQLVQKLYKLVEELSPAHTIHASATPLKARPTEAIPLLKTTDPLFKGEAVEAYTKVFGASKAVALDMLNNRLGILKFKITKEQYSRIEEVDKDLKVKMPNSDKYLLDNVVKLMAEKAREYTLDYIEKKNEIVARFNELHNIVATRVGRDDPAMIRYKRQAKKMHDNFDPYADKDILQDCKAIEKEYHLNVLEGPERKEFKALAPMYKYPQLSIRGKLLGNVLGKLRIECFVDMAKNMELEKIIDSSIKKTVIFTSYVDAAKSAYNYCVEKGYEPIIINQETNKDLPQLLAKAEKDPKANPIIATYQSLGTGNEVVMCSTYVAIDVPFREYIRIQARARINRASQDTDVTYYEAVLDTDGKPNLSTRNLDILKWSKDQVDEMLGIEGEDYDVEEETDIQEQAMVGFR